MPTRRLVVALTVLMLGVFGVGLVTALGRVADRGRPSARGPSETPSPPTFVIDPTVEPTTDPTVESTEIGTTPPSTGGDGDADGDAGSDTEGNGDADADGGTAPNMPDTGASAALGTAAVTALAAAAGARRLIR